LRANGRLLAAEGGRRVVRKRKWQAHDDPAERVRVGRREAASEPDGRPLELVNEQAEWAACLWAGRLRVGELDLQCS